MTELLFVLTKKSQIRDFFVFNNISMFEFQQEFEHLFVQVRQH